MTLLEVDGSAGEGGGQILRIALALASVTGRGVRVRNVRAGRPNPGLARQHLTAAEAVASLCAGKAEGLRLESTEVALRPGRLKGGRVRLDVGTAGSVTLVLQACLPPAAFADAPTHLEIHGGTDVKWSPPTDYFQHVFLSLLNRMGVRAEMQVARRGYYPRGGGRVEVHVDPVPSLAPLALPEAGRVRRIGGRVHVSRLPEHVAQRMKRAALQGLAGYPEVRVSSGGVGEEEAAGPGGALVLWGETEHALVGASALAERGVRAEDLGRQAAAMLRSDLESGATLDIHAADQLLPYMALAKGPSSFLVREVSGHTRTLLGLLPRFLPVEFQEEAANGLTRIEVRPTRT